MPKTKNGTGKLSDCARMNKIKPCPFCGSDEVDIHPLYRPNGPRDTRHYGDELLHKCIDGEFEIVISCETAVECFNRWNQRTGKIQNG